jgi:penicillin V acylase-like amidase (Ntn superfamily)
MKIFYIFPIFLFVALYSVELFACTIFHTNSKNGGVLIGRNFDWESSGGKVWFIPGNEKMNDITIFEQKGVDMPYEGINNKGLFIGIAAVPTTDTPFIMLKPIRKSLEMVRVVLEQADSIDEAIKVFHQYDVAFGKFLGNPQIHYKIVDAGGNSAIVDFIDSKMKVIKDTTACQVMTNHYISNHSLGKAGKTSFERYNTASNALNKSDQSLPDVQKILKTVSQDTTVWSNVYDVNTQKIYVSYKGSETLILDLKKEMYLGEHGYNLQNIIDKEFLKYVDKKSSITFRPHFGYGSLDGKNIPHYGGRLLLPAGEIRRWGLEFTKFDSDDSKFTALGIVLEQRLFEWFNMSIGTVGYFDYGKDSDNVIGLTTNLGWEPDNHIPFKPFITYRNDVIFDKDTDVLHSISVGFSFEF